MVATAVQEAIKTLCIEKDIFIAAPPDLAFEATLEGLGPANEIPGGTPMPMVLEAWPGGRWYRDLGNNSGHLWGHIQVIKPPSLLEICGPLFMSYACANHVQYRFVAEGSGTRLKLVHRAIGEIAAEHRDGVDMGWTHILGRLQKLAEARLKST
ncbi:MAG TPA: SRPBCC domain-containing protein [Pirellulales bacterium]|nr:SRPBCC domain-containing protein [Pirellulales bacterium]